MKIIVLKGAGNIFAVRLKELMLQNKKKQSDLSELLNVTRQSIGQYCEGISLPPADKIVMIAKYFNVSTDYLLGISDTKTTDADLKAVCKYTGLTEEAVKILNQNISNKLFGYALNYIIHDNNFFRELFNYTCVSAIYEIIQQSEYRLIPQKITSYCKDFFFARIIEKIPLLRSAFIEELKEDKSKAKMLCIEYLKQYVDLEECENFIINDEYAEITSQAQELLNDIDYVREQEEHDRICEEEARREMEEDNERAMKKYDIIRKFLKYIKNEKEGESHGNDSKEGE